VTFRLKRPARLASDRTEQPARPARSARPHRTAGGLVAALTVVVLGAAACSTSSGDASTAQTEGAAEPVAAPAVLDQATLKTDAAAMVQRTPKPLQADRLADGLVPPTNRWFSSLALGEKALPVFPMPLSYTPGDAGFGLGLPKVTTSDKTIMGGAVSDVTVTVPGVKSTVVSGYDDLTVTLEQRDDSGKPLGHTVLAQGSPYLTFTAATDVTLGQNVSFAAGDVPTVQVAGHTYGLVLDKATLDGTSVKVDSGGSVTWFPVPDGGSAATMAGLAARITGSSVSYSATKDTATTKLSYTSSGGEGAVAAMPHQQAGLASGTTCDLGTYPSVYGVLKVCRGSSLQWSAPVRAVQTGLDLDGLSADDKTTLTAQVKADIAAIPAFPADTYFGGKSLQRAGQLYELATQLGMSSEAAAVKAKIVEQLNQWTDPQGCAKRPAFCFVYDAKGHGLVGQTASFGSDEYNDHHFHYGYFLYTAGLLAKDDPALAAKWKPVMDLVAADIAGTSTGGLFPDRRVFDAYNSHSWASGTSPFGDGNNQESTSEAVNAWVGLSLWATASKNQALGTEATWMLSGEQDTALKYGLAIDRSDPVYKGFGHQVLTLSWGGKRDYATWFSPAPAAMLGILLLPSTPSSVAYLKSVGADQIRAEVKEATTGAGYNQKFGDYLLMYSALAGEQDREAALQTATSLDSQWIDDGNTKSYLLAWIMSLKS
jgi:endo-1,3(4)-beta-glucanase